MDTRRLFFHVAPYNQWSILNTHGIGFFTIHKGELYVEN